MDRRTLRIGLLLLCGAGLGLGTAQIAGELYRMRAGRADLLEYADTLQRTATLIDHEAESTVRTVQGDQLPFCSPAELALMRGLVYRSNEIKDIGRVRNRRFYCSSDVGLVPRPLPMPLPDVSFRNTLIYVSAPVLLGDNAQGFVVETGGVDVVLNPNAFHAFSEPEMSYAAFLYDQRTSHLVQGFGTKMPVTKKEILAGQLVERKGAYYLPTCSAQARICVVAGETRDAFRRHGQATSWILLFAGACLGECLVLALLLILRRHRSSERQLRRALRREELRLVYQPIVDLQSGVIVGAEALLRWTSEDGRVVSPEVFSALAEERGFITEITRFALCRAVQEMRDVLVDGNFRLTVNISAADLHDQRFFPYLQQTLEDAGVRAASVGLEITERSTAAKEAAIAMIARLRDAGHSVYIDDFGTGYSSLAYLRDLAVDAIKVDRAFTATVGTDAVTESIVPQILQLAEQLGLSVVVEGIETAEQAAYFRRAGKRILGQGWFYGQPVAAKELQVLVNADVDAVSER